LTIGQPLCRRFGKHPSQPDDRKPGNFQESKRGSRNEKIAATWEKPNQAGFPRFSHPETNLDVKMTADQFRRLALSLPCVSERAHMEHPDFRVGGKIFATLGYPDDAWGMLKLTPQQQQQFVRTQPKIFVPAKGAWGRQGSTTVCLKAATKATLSAAMIAAWRNIAPEDLAEEVTD
jgi:hypothetical protein